VYVCVCVCVCVPVSVCGVCVCVWMYICRCEHVCRLGRGRGVLVHWSVYIGPRDIPKITLSKDSYMETLQDNRYWEGEMSNIQVCPHVPSVRESTASCLALWLVAWASRAAYGAGTVGPMDPI
jgi:hypothetical protein